MKYSVSEGDPSMISSPTRVHIRAGSQRLAVKAGVMGVKLWLGVGVFRQNQCKVHPQGNRACCKFLSFNFFL